MVPRDTSTGVILEDMILPSLKRGGYTWDRQVVIGTRPNGGQHKADVVVFSNSASEFPVSLKWQQTSGTAEQKVPYEVICLTEAIFENNYDKAYLVLGGEGWTLRQYYISGELNKYLQYPNLVKILSLESFVALANNKKL